MTESTQIADAKERRRMLQMAFPLYLSYLTSEQKPAAACFVPAQPGSVAGTPVTTGAPASGGARAPTASVQVQAKTMDGAPVPVVPMDCYEDMFHEIAKKFYGDGALVPGGIVQQGSDQNGTGAPGAGQQQGQTNTQGELGMMDLDYQQVGKDGHYQTTGQGASTGPTLIVQTTGGPVLQVTMEATPHVGNAVSHHPSPPKKPKMSVKLKKAAAAAAADAAAATAAAAAAAQNNSNAAGGSGKPVESTWVESDDLLPWNPSKVASYNATHKLFRCLECGCVGFLARIAEHWLGAHANLRVFQCPRCHYNSAWARCIRMHLARQHNEQNPDSSLWRENPVLEEVTKYLLALKNRVESKDEMPSPGNGTAGGDKRYSCPYCPYATDRRDLYTRHETIHSEEKPFQCFICDKQFNRADHCKKHFSRMHRDTAYDLQKIKKAAGGGGDHGQHTPTTAVKTPVAHVVVAAAVPPTQVPFYTAVAVQQQQTNQTVVSQNNQQQQQQQTTVQRTPAPVVAAYQSHLGLPAFPSQPTSTQAYKSYTTLGVEALVRPTHTIATPTSQQSNSNATSAQSSQASGGEKKKKEKLYACTYCAWRGVDNWCLKRHLNTHIKPYLCVLCDYKAARSERLATHVHKVHNKRICGKCNFLADDQDALSQHMREHHQNPIGKTERTVVNAKGNKSQETTMDHMDERGSTELTIGIENRPNQILLQCEMCEFRTTDGNLIHTHLAENHHRSNTMDECQI